MKPLHLKNFMGSSWSRFCRGRIQAAAVDLALLAIFAVALAPSACAETVEDALTSKANALYSAGKYAEAAEIFAALEPRLIKLYGPDSDQVGENYYQWALNNELLGKYDLAIDLYNRGLDVARKIGFGGRDSDWLDHVATCYIAKKNFDAAARIYREEIEIDSALRKPGSGLVFQVNTHMRLADVYHSCKKYQEELAVLQEAVKLSDVDLGSRKDYEKQAKEHPAGASFVLNSLRGDVDDITSALMGLGDTYSYLGEYDKALPAYKRADEIIDEWYPESFKPTEFYEKYAFVLGKLNRTKEANAIVAKGKKIAAHQKK